MRALLLLGAYVAAAPLMLAHAEPRRTLEEVTLRKKPGEKEAVIARLPAGTPVTVLALDGRWLLVRVTGGTGANGVNGYLTRTTVSAPAPGDTEPGASWSAARKREGQDGQIVSALYVQVAAPRAALRATPSPAAPQVAEVARGGRLEVVDAASDPAWTHVRDAAGHDGWIARDQIDNGAAAVAVAVVDSAELREGGRPGGDAGARTTRALAVRADLGIGFRALGMDLTSNAEGGLTNYVLDADAVAATLDLDVAMRLAGRMFVAADARVSASDSSPGIDYPGPTAPAGKIAFRTLTSDTGVRVGLRARRVFDLAVRAGAHYDAFVATDVKNAGMLPRERLLGATLGARVDIAPARSRFTITARFDALVLGGRRQTAGLEDGTSSTARALWGGLTMRYAVLGRVAVFGGYDFSRASTQWSGMSVRQPGVTRTERVDTAQLVQLGISAAL
jgi:SH3-like domain-containing protein